MLPSAAAPSRSRSAPVVGRVLLDIVALVTVVTPGPVGTVPCGGAPGLAGGPVGGVGTVGGVQLPWQDGGGVHWSPWQDGGGVQRSPSHDGGRQSLSWQDGGVGGLINEPPWQAEFAKPSSASETPQMFTGALTGAEIVLPELVETLPSPVTLPLPGPDVPDGSVTRVRAQPAQW